MWISPGYFIFMLPAIVLAVVASAYTQVTFSRYARLRSRSGVTGAEAARRLLDSQGISGIRIEPVGGFLTDHYDPMSRTLRLSPSVYQSDSLAAIGVACHEAGHALQHARRYAPLALRTGLVPAAQIGNYAPYILLPLGYLFGSMALIKLGILLFAVAVFFSIVTLPVEWNASSRAKALMVRSGIVGPEEAGMAGQVLNAAFLTYVAGAVTAVMTLLYYLMRMGLLGGRRD